MEASKKPLHRRNKPSRSAILKSLVSPKSPPSSPEPSSVAARPFRDPNSTTDHSQPQIRGVLGELQNNVQSPPSAASKKRTAQGREVGESQGTKVLHKSTNGSSNDVKKSKSSTNLAAVFAKMNRSTKDLSVQVQKDKENATPLPSPNGNIDTPIWAQYNSQSATDSQSLEDQSDKAMKTIQDEIDRYTPQVYSPRKQRNFNGSLDQPHARPTLSKDRPVMPHTTPTESFLSNIGRQVSGRYSADERRRSQDSTKKDPPILGGRKSREKPRLFQRSNTDRTASGSSAEQASTRDKLNITKRGGRVMAAVAAFQSKNKDPQSEQKKDEATLDPKAVETAFEAVLDSRNIPEPMRQKMRTLTLRVKADFVRQDQGSKSTKPSSSTSAAPDQSKSAMTVAIPVNEDKQEGGNEKQTKHSRSRSRTFTWSKGDKKNTSDGISSRKRRSQSRSRPISIETSNDSTMKGQLSAPGTPTTSFGRQGGPPAIPAEYITYLRKHQDPTMIEVGRLHKLRILLRNETVAWVDDFISQGGMIEIVGLLHKIMAIEWREDHEDQLLHETLLCLKGLCTTGRALSELNKVADDLFPALLAMLFDDEKKGPAEYTTRTIIINVLLNFLTSATETSPSTLEERARKILTYLGEPPKPEDARPVNFVLGMRVPRPYKLWCREISNVSKEVFWIFLHHLNVVPLPKPGSSGAGSERGEIEQSRALQTTYTRRHFPGPRPPVPAAPYVGGVEWDATTYITAHLDLLNGLIASLPTAEARNTFRQELLASGFEKNMGTTLRTCKEKFYSGVHDGLRVWVAAAAEDEWPTRFVREGPSEEEIKEQAVRARSASPKKKRKNEEEAPRVDAPVIDAPQLDLSLRLNRTNTKDNDDDAWLG